MCGMLINLWCRINKKTSEKKWLSRSTMKEHKILFEFLITIIKPLKKTSTKKKEREKVQISH